MLNCCHQAGIALLQHNTITTKNMAKYTVTHKCGHNVDHTLYGKMDDRDSKLAWLATQDCMACRRKAEAALAAEATAKVDLAPLQGSDKQVAWATTIRGLKYTGMVAALRAEVRDVVGPKLVNLLNQASWWIDHRDADISFKDLLDYLHVEGKDEEMKAIATAQ